MISQRRIASSIAVSMIILASFSLVAMNSSADLWDRSPDVTTNREVYLVGETVKVNVTCYVGATFSSSGQCFFVVKDAQNNTVYDFRDHIYVLWVLTSLFPPKTFSFSWDQKNDKGQLVPPGIYEIWGFEAGWSFYSDPPIAANSTTITIVEDTQSTESVEVGYLYLVQGWNLISMPLLTSNYTASNLGLPFGSVVATLNPATGSYEVFIVGVSPLSSSFPLVDFRGYFVYAASSCTIAIFGVPVTTTFIINLHPGWNLVGFPKISKGSIVLVNQILAWFQYPPPPPIIICSYSSATHAYTAWLSSVPGMNNFAIYPGVGYAVYAGSGGIIGYGP